MPKANLKKMTKTELIELARKRKVAIKTSMLKAEILALLEKAEKAKAKKPVKAKTAAAKAKKTPAKKAAPKTTPAKKAKPPAVKTAAPVKAKKTKTAAARPAAARKAAPKSPALSEPGPFSRWPRSAAKTKTVPGSAPQRDIELEDKAQEAKFIVGAPDHHEPWETTQPLPAQYGDHRLVLLARDPYWVHLFWELDAHRIDRGLSELGCSMEAVRCVLRVHPLTQDDAFDVDVDFRTGRHYMPLSPPGASFYTEIGMIDPNGRFYCLARSNSVTLPKDGPSEVTDEQWMTTDEEFERIYLLSGGSQAGNGSGSEGHEKREHGARKWVMDFPTSPGSHGSASLGAARERGFRFWLDAELVLYGGADPGSRIELNGEALDTRPDGTFTVRLALPDGDLTLPVRFVSPDGEEAHSAEVSVNRKTRIEQETPDWLLA